MDGTSKTAIHNRTGANVLSAIQHPHAELKKRAAVHPDVLRAARMRTNGAGDLPALLDAVSVGAGGFIFLVALFMILSRWYPEVYAYRAAAESLKERDAPLHWEPTDWRWFRWAEVSLYTSNQEVAEYDGLDAAMLLNLCRFGMEVTAVIGIPMISMWCSCYAFNGDVAKLSGDRLSIIGLSNLPHGSFLFWPLSFTVWYVVIMTEVWMIRWQRRFFDMRMQWLLELPDPRASTLFVKNVTADKRGDAELLAYFQKIYPDEIERVWVVKNIPQLEYLCRLYEEVDLKLHEAEHYMEKYPDSPRPTVRTGWRWHARSDSVKYWTDEADRIEAEIQAEQDRIKSDAALPALESSSYSNMAFVTFTSRLSSQKAVHLLLTEDEEAFEMCYAPDPMDVLWTNLQTTPTVRKTLALIGYILIALLFFTFMPLILFLADFLSIEHLEHLDPFQKLLAGGFLAPWRSMMAGSLPSLGLTVMMSWIPSIMMLIMGALFTFDGNGMQQLCLQSIYFWFLVMFVLLITVVGVRLEWTLHTIMKSPFQTLDLLADTLPNSTHFYLYYLAMQWAVQGLNMTRYQQLGKYVFFNNFFGKDTAKKLSEPEDQDYYGMGSRNARFSFIIVVALVLGTITPLMNFMSFITLAICRLVFGYLIPFAETRKVDTGGEFWVQSMAHIHYTLLIYILLMTGVMSQRAGSFGPTAVCAWSFVWWLLLHQKFQSAFHWQHLPFEDAVELESSQKKRQTLNSRRAGCYKQGQLTFFGDHLENHLAERRTLHSTLNFSRSSASLRTTRTM